MPTCLICFESTTGKRWEDYFVVSGGGHCFHYACVRFMMMDGCSACPACDEDLGQQQWTRIHDSSNSDSASAPPASVTSSWMNLINIDTNGVENSNMAGQGQGASAPVSTSGNNEPSSSTLPATPVSGQGSGTYWKNQQQNKQAPQGLVEDLRNFFEANKVKTTTAGAKKSGVEPTRIPQAKLRTRSLDTSMAAATPIANGRGAGAAEFKFKIVIIGEFGTGKSALIRRYADNAFSVYTSPTVGCDLRMKTIDIGGKSVLLKLWDTAGQERFKQSLVRSYLRNADGVIISYDITSLESLASVHEWYDFAKDYAPSEAVKVMVGNKSDLWHSSHRNVEGEYVANVANHLNVPNFYCSAKDALNVEAVFRSIGTQILETRLEGATPAAAYRVADEAFRLGKTAGRKKQKPKCCDI